ncbi:hypothetical protein [Streptomyces sp. NPDC050121]|uniref:hypothetical protein n=1 Tax=Streptomyces sp. NPDC050121 TaxID=3365601 RepID=UPI00379D9561
MRPAGPDAPDGVPAAPAPPLPSAPPLPAVGRRKTKVPPETTSPLPSSGSAGGIVAVPSVLVDRPSGWAGAGDGTLGSGACGPPPQETRRSWSPPKPDWWARSAPHTEAGSERPSYGSAGAGSSSKKCGPVSSTEAGGAPDGGVSGRPSDGAGRLVPGTQAEPFQYRTYPGMDGSG